MASLKRKPQRSLRNILIIWFLLFSVVPLAFITGYSVIKYEKSIDNELAQRLSGNAREIGVILSDFRMGLEENQQRYTRDARLSYHLSTNDAASLRTMTSSWLKSDFSTSLTFFNRDGRMLVSLAKDDKGDVRDMTPNQQGVVYLSDQNLEKLKDIKDYAFIEYGNKKISLILFSKVFGSSQRHVGYIEQLIDIDTDFLLKMKQRMKLEIILLKPKGQVLVATHSDFLLYKSDFFSSHMKSDAKDFFELNLRNNPYGFVMYPLTWGNSEIYLALGASKGDAKAVLKNVNYAFYSVVAAVIILLILTIFITSKTILKPLNELVEAIDNVQSSDRPVEIPIKSDTEIGLLTESFNQMSRSVVQARGDLKKKIAELETINQELKEAQSKLVHSSKMISLGQLVAGVAHELNNPIGFIYSNMVHLREYAERLISYAEAVEKNPAQVSQLREKYEIEYVKTDLPKLVTSCEDGARRTRDIVLGLRNFSRLEEAQLKEIDLHEGIDNTLNLLSGEIKNRIQVHKNYAKLPAVSCFASQINQVFMNILSNAVQAIEGNGDIWISTSLENSQVKVSFQDSGKGISAQVMEKIFDPFFSTKGVGQGTGLGLSISYGIIQNHGGDILVKSQEGVGTEFTVMIPVKAQIKAKDT